MDIPPSVESEDEDIRGRDRHRGAEAAHHTGAHRKRDVGLGSLPSGDEVGSGGHSHPVHSRDPGEWGSETAHGSGPGDCSREGEESGGRTLP